MRSIDYERISLDLFTTVPKDAFGKESLNIHNMFRISGMQQLQWSNDLMKQGAFTLLYCLCGSTNMLRLQTWNLSSRYCR